jgi:shikimate kinase
MKFKITESIEDKAIFKAIFMAGIPGSGKSYVLSKITDVTIEPRIVNTDKFVEYFDIGYDEDAPRHLIDKVKILTQEQLYLYLNSMLPLFVDSTSSRSRNIIKRRGILQSLGYDIGMIFVNTSLETALARIEQRKRKVSREWTIQAYEKINELKDFYKTQFPNFYEVDNDEGELTDRAILRAYKKVRKFYTTPIQNPEGIHDVKIMRQSGWKYLTDGTVTESYLRKLISVWYMK